MAYYQGPSALDTYINLNPGTINRPRNFGVELEFKF